MKGITKMIENERKGQKRGYLGMLLSTLGASLLGNMWTGKGMLWAGYGNKYGKGMLRAFYESKMDSATSFNNKHWNTEVLSEWTQI